MGHKVGVPDQQISLGCVRGRRIRLLEDQAEAPVSEASGEDGVAGGSGATTSEQTRERASTFSACGTKYCVAEAGGKVGAWRIQ